MCDKPAMVSRDVNRDGFPITTVLLELAPADRAVAQAGLLRGGPSRET